MAKCPGCGMYQTDYGGAVVPFCDLCKIRKLDCQIKALESDNAKLRELLRKAGQWILLMTDNSNKTQRYDDLVTTIDQAVDVLAEAPKDSGGA